MYEVLGMTSEGGVNYNVARNTLSWLSILNPICCEGRLRIMYPAPNMSYKLKWHLQNKKFSCSHECWLLFKGQRDKEGNGADQLWRTTDPWQQWLSHFSDNLHLRIGLILEHRLKTTSMIFFICDKESTCFICCVYDIAFSYWHQHDLFKTDTALH